MNLLQETLSWLTDPAHWTGPESIPLRVVQHLAVTAAAVVLAALLAVPVGVAIGHSGRGRVVVVALAGAARAIPTLGLLTLLALLLGIGLRAPLVALVVLAIPSLLAGCYSGIQSVDPVLVDSARANGYTEAQVITHVELPLAAPVMVGALRAATLQVVATATLAAYVADVGLGRYLFTGLKSRDYPQMLAGALLVTALALALEISLAALQRTSARKADPAHSRRAQPHLSLTEGPS
jgi:osmoprotectant transport system permease protein